MKTTLVAVSGMSPAIITESLWALAREKPPVIPDDVIVITTARGKTDIESNLLGDNPDWGGKSVWETLRADLLARAGHPKKSACLQLSVRVIELPDPATGIRRPAEDLRTRQHNEEAADFIIRVLAPLCDSLDCHVIASIAGGRKTMGALLYAGMSLLGKESDRVTHVLVSEPFDTVRGFFYPGQPVRKLKRDPRREDSEILDSATATVEMADLPFVPLRNKFRELNEPTRTFAGLVDAYSQAPRRDLNKPPSATLDTDKGILTVEGRPLRLSGRDLLVCAFLLARAQGGHPHFANKHEAEKLLGVFNADWKIEHPFHPALTRLSGGVSIDDIPKALANLRKKLSKAGLGEAIGYLAPERSRIGFDIAPS